MPLGAQLVLAVTIPVLLLLAYSSRDAVAAIGTSIGLGIGIVLESYLLCFSAGGPVNQRLVRLVLGIAIVILLREGLKVAFPGEGEPFYTFFRVLRYSLVGLWAAFGGPWVFVRLELAGSSNDVSKRQL
jgi:hypothetical protein